MERGFRYQTGEIERVAKELKENKRVQMDIDNEDEIDDVIGDLHEYDIYLEDGVDFDYLVPEMVDNGDFHARVFFEDEMYIDFFLVGSPEQSYEMYWGE